METLRQHDILVEEAPIVIDIEASGLGPRSYPIEIGVALPDDRGFCTLVRPEPDWTFWDTEAEAIHHIPRFEAARHGRPAAEVADVLNSELAGKVVYSDGWAHDYSWLSLLYDVAGRRPSFRLDNLRSLLTEEEAARWHDTKVQLRAELRPERHRASNDARVLQLTLLRIKRGHQVHGSAARAHEVRLIDEMVELDALTLSDFIADSLGRFDRAVRREHHVAALAGGGRVLAEHLNHRLAGYVLLRPALGGEWEILAINIHPWYRSTGLHRRLMTRTLAHLLSHGAHVVTSLVLASQEQAARLHERLGFSRKDEAGGMVRYSLPVADLARRLRQG